MHLRSPYTQVHIKVQWLFKEGINPASTTRMPHKESPYDKEYEWLLPVWAKVSEAQLEHAGHLYELLKAQEVARSSLEHKFMSSKFTSRPHV